MKTPLTTKSSRFIKTISVYVFMFISISMPCQADNKDLNPKWTESLIPVQIDPKQNPGDLTALLYKVADSTNLVVLLHGCGQSATHFTSNAGLFRLAEKFGANLLLVQQSKQNNPQGCFNWFSKNDTDEDKGEHASISALAQAAESSIGQPQHYYLIGLSAGAAMANAIFVQQPEKYRGVAAIAGIPYPCAQSLVQAISCMKAGPNSSGQELAKGLKGLKAVNLPKNQRGHASKHVIVITGIEDSIVSPENSNQTVEQYKTLLSLTESPRKVVDASYTALFYRGQADESHAKKGNFEEHKIDYYRINGMGHGLPIDSKSATGEQAAPYFIDVGLSAGSLVFKAWFGSKRLTKQTTK